MNPTFELKHKDSLTKARACKIKTSHGEINTPVFMPVGTPVSYTHLTLPTKRIV